MTKTHDKKRILVLVETSRVFGREIIRGITRFAVEAGDWTLFLEDRGLVQHSDFWMKHFEYDGIITRTTHRKGFEWLRKKRLPLVELLGYDREAMSEIMTDAAALGLMAAEHFRGKGLLHFAFFSMGQCWWSSEFSEEYRRALQLAGLPCEISPFSLRSSDVSLPVSLRKDDERRISAWLSSLTKPVGIFCPADSHALFLINLCRFVGIAVPQEIAILGVENNESLCNAASPPLSSIAANGQEIGYRAAELLERKLKDGPLPDLPVKIAPIQVITRQSSDLVAIADPDISKAIQFIRDYVSSRITVRHVADHAGLSVRTLLRRFHESVGHSPETEILKMRMERARSLLRETDMAVSAIARSLGYLTSEYFIRAFRRECGMTPKKFRDTMSLK